MIKFFVVISIFISSLFSSNSCHAYMPSLESLLRNGQNPDIADKTVRARFKITQILRDGADGEEVGASTTSERTMFYEFLISNVNKDFPQLYQFEFENDQYNMKSAVNKIHRPVSAINKVLKSRADVDKRFFYSMMMSLLRNDGKLMVQFLKSLEIPAKFNKELINWDKKNLLDSYKSYLVDLKNEKEGITNPLKPLTVEEKENVSKIMKQPYLTVDENIKRVNVRGQIFYDFNIAGLRLRFDSEHRIKYLRLSTEKGSLNAVFGDFIAFKSGTKFPELIVLTDTIGTKYELRMNEVRLLDDTKSSFSRRVQKYKVSTGTEAVKLPFLL